MPALSGVPILQVLLLLCLGLWIFRSDKRLGLPPFIFVVLFTLFSALTVGLNGYWGGVPLAIGLMSPIIVIFFVASMASRKLQELQACMRTILICACLIVYYCMVQVRTGVGPVTGIPAVDARPYYVGIFSDPNDIGQLFIIALSFAINLLSVARTRSSKFLFFASAAWLFYGVILTNSRGALLASLLLLALEGWRRYGKVAVGIGAVLGLPVLFALTRLKQLDSEEQSANDRIQAWYDGIQMLQVHPLYGIGFGKFADYTGSGLTAHNSIVLPMGELGLIGLTLWLGILWYCMRMLWWAGFSPHAKLNADNTLEALGDEASAEILAARGLFMTLLAFEVSSFFLSQSYKAPLFLLCGLAVARFIGATAFLTNQPNYRFLPDFARLGVLTAGCVLMIDIIVRIAL